MKINWYALIQRLCLTIVFSSRILSFPTERFREWQKVLHRMDYTNDAHKKMMDMEGLKEWVEGRITGFQQLREANDYLKFFNHSQCLTALFNNSNIKEKRGFFHRFSFTYLHPFWEMKHMKRPLPLFPTSLIGSMPRSKEVLSALRMMRRGTIEPNDFNKLIERETQNVIKLQEDLGIDIITSGEIGRDNYVSFVSDKIGGVRMMSMSEMLDYIDDKKAFENILTTLDVPAVSIRNAICVGKLKYNGDIVANELMTMKKFTDKPVKITLPGPYLLTRSMWLPNLSGKVYGSKEELGQDVIKIMKEEIDNLMNIGVDVIQLDEPVLTEVVFTEGKPRSFMCAALSERKDPKEELEFASSLIGQIIGAYRSNKDGCFSSCLQRQLEQG